MTIVKSALRSGLISIALLVVVFVGGLLAGAAMERTLRGTPVEARSARGEMAQQARERDRERARDQDRERDQRSRGFMDQIGLTDEQQARIDSIVEHGREETRAFWEHEGGRLREIVDETRAGVQSVLTAEQRERWDQMRTRRSGGSRGGAPSMPGHPPSHD